MSFIAFSLRLFGGSRHSFEFLLAVPHPALIDLDSEARALRQIDMAVFDAKRLDRDILGKARLVTVRPQAIPGATAATCSAAAEAMLDSPVLQEMFTLMPSRSQSRHASSTARRPPSLIALRLTPRAALRS